MLGYMMTLRGRLTQAMRLPSYEVSGAGLDAANGVFVPAVLPTYSGPPTYQLPSTNIFIFRWQQVGRPACPPPRPVAPSSSHCRSYRRRSG